MFNGLTEFDFGHVGLTVVHGLNRSGGKGTNNPNAAGKSALFASVQDLLYREVLVGSRRDRVTAGNASLILGKNKNELYKLVSKNNKLAVFKNGSKTDMGFREKAQVDEFIKDIVPPSLVAYATLCHIDDRVPHPLARGETDVRRKFFTKFFELDSTDYRRKLISSRISDVQASARLAEDKKSRLEALPKEIADLKSMRARVAELEEEKASMQSRIDEFSDNASLREFLIDHKDEMDSVPDLDKIRSSMEKYEVLLEQVDVHSEYRAALALWSKQNEELQSFVKEHDVKRGEREDLKDKIERSRVFKDNLSRLKEKIKYATEEMEALNKPSEQEANCETCGAELTGDLRKKHDRHFQKAMEKYSAKRSEINDRLATYNTKQKKMDESEDGELPSEKKMQRRLDLLDTMPRVGVKPDKPRNMPKDIDRDDLVSKIKRSRETLNQYQWATGKLWRRAKAVKNVDEFLARKDPTKKYLAIVEELSQISLAYTIAKKQETERATLTTEIEELDEELSNIEALEILEKAYGPRGFRRVLINTICTQLEKTLTRYSKILFPEDYSFELELDKQFHILVTRKYNNKVLSSDVRRLSGAESSMFGLLLWAGLMSFVPKAHRPNFLILDEVDARLGPEMTERFLTFLPRMLKVVEHVIVVTPKSETRYEDYVPNVRYLTVVKKGLSSTIAEGKSADQNRLYK